MNAVWIALVIITLDRATKYIIESLMEINQSIPLIDNFLHLTLIHNKGAGFGILQGQRLFFIIFSLIVLAVVIHKWKEIPQNINITFPLGMILGGLIGNLIGRIFLKYVIDFIDFRIWPIFNIADSAITIGVIWLVIYLWKK
ncbi:MAG: signal peptidase II [Nanoarchaeota archaeon]|nr:signal peptidase II [Nanoarchaeota archaeon]